MDQELRKFTGQRACLDRYWRFSGYGELLSGALRRELTDNGWKSRPSDAKHKLVAMAQKATCGRMDYSRCTMKELIHFADDRGIDWDDAESMKDIVALLMAADDVRSFHCFLDLPPELRNIIYGCYLDSMPSEISVPSRPPLAKTCKQVDKELTPLFLSEKVIRLPYYYAGDRHRRRHTVGLLTDKFFHSCLKNNASQLRSFVVEIRPRSITKHDLTAHPFACAITIERKPPGDVPSTTYVLQDIRLSLHYIHDAPLRKLAFTNALRHVLKKLGGRRLQVSDIHDVSKTAERIFNYNEARLENHLALVNSTAGTSG
ncbi:hypothetical protein LTR78_006283 [Recurvomyces mirabilis]|uniref:F-box domain-containing protein n=1 Tax=Recurvomyces mirabilis TaxID=574656 RepID=A0AAE1C011_9PEZI|nr:hypothetical protein LTR78_006283 [Recurvomyces mirabilis]KAK5152172.1 hypothetical protein LTS14_008547 [Recurvomyces mirabilis]